MTTIVGKDAPLEQSIEHFTDTLKKLNIEVVEDNWLNPLDNVYSVHLAIASLPCIYTNGKGSSRLAARASAYGELFERLATHLSFSDYYLGLDNSNAPYVHFKDEKWTVIDQADPSLPTDVLNASLRKFYSENTDLNLEDLVDLQSSSFSRGVCSIPFTNARNGEVVYFPVNLLDNLYGSNGMSAGNTEYEALVQGLSEIIERYVKKEVIKRGLSLPVIPDEILSKYEKSYKTLQELKGNHLTAVCYDASLGGKFPVVCVVLFNQSNGTCFASFGSHPIFEVALDRTLTELMQGRTFSDLDNFDAPDFDLERTSDIVNLESHFVDSTGILPMQMFKKVPDYRFVAWDFSGNTQEQYKALRYMIAKLGFDIYVRSYNYLGVCVYRTVVPGMSEIYPVDDLIYNNTNSGIDFQEALLSLPQTEESVETYKSYLDELENENVDNDALVCPLLGILPDSKSAWESLRMGELRCLIALAAGEHEKALEYAQWTISFNQVNFTLDKIAFYQCITKILECKTEGSLKLEDYQQGLQLLFGKETFETALDHVNGNARFGNLIASDLNLKGFSAHQELIRIYNILKEAQENHNVKK
ncbi:MAG: YcaO-like family protein [Succinivibrio dextrinosolvens]|uniref:YcaO-like family protein n=1 Tax=Succinivibrio sp. TaxID=2053619 RepID=UPI0025ED11BF|nr:YcaO-like family protein [Succinivibrio sp.]MBQ9220116.1 YcaO-like family protein [Succinivibrio sp.]MDY6419055.1 YcaO-like family protein [Succinivibrio dextrinosolvens]MDY6466104.1 YcaO-like family protein [Succinivibrio dextrinosolvens]MDY6470714.1 YcaO-like family protein [Succinivibrio dextrinosolvens]